MLFGHVYTRRRAILAHPGSATGACKRHLSLSKLQPPPCLWSSLFRQFSAFLSWSQATASSQHWAPRCQGIFALPTGTRGNYRSSSREWPSYLILALYCRGRPPRIPRRKPANFDHPTTRKFRLSYASVWVKQGRHRQRWRCSSKQSPCWFARHCGP